MPLDRAESVGSYDVGPGATINSAVPTCEKHAQETQARLIHSPLSIAWADFRPTGFREFVR
jgi:hypothetical protein